MASRYPKWVTLNRQTHLVKLFIDSKGFCVYGHKPCPIPSHHYEIYIEAIIAEWQADDRIQRQADWQDERRTLHSTSDRRFPLHGQFSAVSKDIFFAEQPLYYLSGFGISGLTFKPFAKVKLPSSFVYLYVNIDKALGRLSKNKRRKAIRHGGRIPLAVEEDIGDICKSAVKHYLDHR